MSKNLIAILFKEVNMAIPSEVIAQVLERANIYDVISRYTTLKRSGSSAKGLCPFHSEKTPSFSVSEQKQVYHCFGCGASGSVINFVSNIENLSFVEAVKFLGDMYGIRVEDTAFTDDRLAKRKSRIYEINKTAARFFYDNLISEKGYEARKYLLERGLTNETINRFGLGYAENSFNSLINFLKGTGFSDYEISDAGLSAKKDNKKPYDFFRNRVMFPVFDVRGNVIAFGGRVLDDSKPKYLNSPETPVFDKRKNLFGLNIAKKSSSKRFILVEGYMDTISLHQHGADTAIASLGTSLTEDHAKLLKRYADEIVLCYDSDGAGQAAASRAIEILSKHDIKTKVLTLSGAKDPDEFVKKFGLNKFLESIEGSKVPVLHNIGAIKAKYDISVPEQKVEFLKLASFELAKLSSAIEREIYIKEVSKMADVSFETLSLQVKKSASGMKKKEESAEKQNIIRDLKQRTVIKDNSSKLIEELEMQLLNLMFYNISVCNFVKDNFDINSFSKELFIEFAQKITAIYEISKAEVKESDFISSFDFEVSGSLAEILSIETHFEDKLSGAKQIINKLKALKQRELIKQLGKSGDINQVRDLLGGKNQ